MGLTYEVVKGAFVLPCRPLPEKRDEPRMSTPVFNANFEPIERARLRRVYSTNQSSSDILLDTREAKQYLESAIYGGFLHPHFGHFILEGLARIWVSDFTKSDLPIIFHSVSNRMFKHHIEALELVGISRDRVRFVTEPTKVDTLIVPDAGFIISSQFHRIHADFLARDRMHQPTDGRRVWLSRSELPESLAVVGGEKDLEAHLAREGWIIFHPEKCDLPSQVATISHAQIIAGIEGSALHSVIFLRTDRRLKIKILPRTSNPRRTVQHNYILIAQTKKIDQSVYGLPMQLENCEDHRSPIRINSISGVLNFLLAD